MSVWIAEQSELEGLQSMAEVYSVGLGSCALWVLGRKRWKCSPDM